MMYNRYVPDAAGVYRQTTVETVPDIPDTPPQPPVQPAAPPLPPPPPALAAVPSGSRCAAARAFASIAMSTA